MIVVTNRQIITMKTRQPAGTNHNQFRDHQPRRIGGGVPEGIGGGTGGGGVLVGSTMGGLHDFERMSRLKTSP
jgi:hypothetical protein